MNNEPTEPISIGSGDPGTPAPEPASFGLDSEDYYKETVLANLPDEYKENKTLLQSKSIKSLLDQTVNAQAALGKKRLQVPDENWTDDQWQEHYSHLRPEEYTAAETLELRLEEGGDLLKYEMTEDTSNKLKAAADAMNLDARQFAKLQEIWGKEDLGAHAHNEASIKAAVEEHTNNLRKEWGDGYTIKHKAANEAFEQLANEIPELNDLMNWSPLVANHPAVMKLFERLSPLVKDLPMPNGGSSGSFGNETVAQIKAQIAAIDSENQELLYGKIETLTPADKAKRERLLKERTDLYGKLYATS